jgi:sporulation protein YlmC with PRC-barrel domain
MGRFRRLIVIAAALALAAAPVALADQARPAGDARADIRPHPGGLVAAHWLVDAPVTTADGKRLGSIIQVWLDPEAGRVQQVVVAGGGLEGEPVTYRVLMWDEVQVAWTDDELVVVMDEQALRQARDAEEADRGGAPAASPPAEPGRDRR